MDESFLDLCDINRDVCLKQKIKDLYCHCTSIAAFSALFSNTINYIYIYNKRQNIEH